MDVVAFLLLKMSFCFFFLMLELLWVLLFTARKLLLILLLVSIKCSCVLRTFINFKERFSLFSLARLLYKYFSVWKWNHLCSFAAFFHSTPPLNILQVAEKKM